MTTARYAAIAFDLDGTLVDTAPDIAHALNGALRDAGLRTFDLPTIRGWIGGGPDVLIRHALAAQDRADAPGDLRHRLRAAFDIATLIAPLDHGTVFDGIEATLRQLARRMPLVVVTNKPTPLARAVLAAARLLQCVCEVHGADQPAQRKPSPALLLAAAQRLALPPRALLMVGDSGADVQAALAAGCGAALVDWGYGAADPGADDPRVWRVRTPQHLLGAVLLGHPQAARAAP